MSKKEIVLIENWPVNGQLHEEAIPKKGHFKNIKTNYQCKRLGFPSSSNSAIAFISSRSFYFAFDESDLIDPFRSGFPQME